MTTPQRIHIIGSAGSGKTTLGRELSARQGIPHVELDALYWGPNWQESEREDFRRSVAEALAGDAWVVEGNYSKARDLIWERVELVVWLDFSLGVCLWRTLWRTLGRVATREELWNGNRETIVDAFFSRESLMWYLLKTHRRRRRQYAGLSSLPENADIRFVRLRKPSELGEFLDSLTS